MEGESKFFLNIYIGMLSMRSHKANSGYSIFFFFGIGMLHMRSHKSNLVYMYRCLILCRLAFLGMRVL